MRRDELPLVTLDLRHAGALLAHPCNCGHEHCNLGDHLWQATDNMTPGLRAQTTDPRVRAWPTDTDQPDTPAPADIHAEYTRRLTTAQKAARDLAAFIARNRPDRWTPDPTPATDDMWCTNHLEHFGTCEPRHRGDLCRWCDDISRLHGFLPDRPLMRARHETRRITEAMIIDARKRIIGSTTTRRTKRKRAG